MRRKTILGMIVTFSLFTLQFAVTIEEASASTAYVPGVTVGDWARYIVSVNWTGTLDPSFQLWSEMEWGVIEVTNVSGTVVTFTGIAHLKNGTDQVDTDANWDVAATGSFGLLLWFIGANLEPGDGILPSSILTINETVTRSYNGVSRENNYLNVSLPYGRVPVYDFCNMSCYWDKTTGIVTEQLLSLRSNDPPRSLSIFFEMVDTNMWGTRRLDINLDGKVDGREIALVGKYFGSYRGHPRWNPIADISLDNKIDGKDIVVIAKNFGKTYP